MRITQTHLEYFIKVIGFVAVLLILMQLFGCTAQESVLMPPEDLLEPHDNDWEVAWCNEKHIYVFTDSTRTKMKKIRNIDGSMMFTGDFLIERDEFRYSYNY